MHALTAKASVVLEIVPRVATTVFKEVGKAHAASGCLFSRASTAIADNIAPTLRKAALISQIQDKMTLRLAGKLSVWDLTSASVVQVLLFSSMGLYSESPGPSNGMVNM